MPTLWCVTGLLGSGSRLSAHSTFRQPTSFWFLAHYPAASLTPIPLTLNNDSWFFTPLLRVSNISASKNRTTEPFHHAILPTYLVSIIFAFIVEFLALLMTHFPLNNCPNSSIRPWTLNWQCLFPPWSVILFHFYGVHSAGIKLPFLSKHRPSAPFEIPNRSI